MRLHRFYLASIPETESFSINDKRLVHQITTVLRYKIGEHCIVFSNTTDDYVVSITSMTKDEVVVQKISITPAKSSPLRTVIAAVSIVKRDLFELIVQKLTELGVEIIIPVISDRTIKQDVRSDRLVLISQEAVEQSGRNTLVDIREPLPLEECLSQFPHPSIVFDTATNTSDTVPEGIVVMYIGPEGGWSGADKELFQTHKAVWQTLGSNTLRTETAAIVGAYKLLWQ